MPDCQSEGPGSTPAARSLSISPFVPLSERLGPGLPNRRAGFDSLAVLETAWLARRCPKVWPGPARPLFFSRDLPGWRSWQRGRLLTVSPQVRILPAGRTRIFPGGLVRYASGKRGGCLPPKASSILVRTATSPGYPNQQRTPAQTRCVAGASPVPGTNETKERARSTTEVQPHDKRPTRGSTPPARTKRHEPNVFGYHLVNGQSERDNMFGRFARGGRRDGALPCKQSVAGSTPALSTITESRRRCRR